MLHAASTTRNTTTMTGPSPASSPNAIPGVPTGIEGPDITGSIDPEALGPSERQILERWMDRDGHVGDRDIDTLLRQNLILRRLIADLVASAGRPLPARGKSGYVAEVPTDLLEQIGKHGDFSQIADIEAAGKDWF